MLECVYVVDYLVDYQSGDQQYGGEECLQQCQYDIDVVEVVFYFFMQGMYLQDNFVKMVELFLVDKMVVELDFVVGIVFNSMCNLCCFMFIKMVGFVCGCFRRGNYIELGIIQLIFVFGVVICCVGQYLFYGIERKIYCYYVVLVMVKIDGYVGGDYVFVVCSG